MLGCWCPYRAAGGDVSTSQLMIDILGLEDHYGDMDFKV